MDDSNSNGQTSGSVSTNPAKDVAKASHTGASLKERVFGPILRGARRVAPSDRFLWPAARSLLAGRSQAQTRGVFKTADAFQMRLNLGEYPDGAMYFGVYEVKTIRLLRKLVRPGDTVIDVGANIGYVTLHAAALVGPAGKVFSFEPVPYNFERATESIQLNHFAQVNLQRAGAGAERGSFKIYTFESDDNSRHVLASMQPLYEKNQEIQCDVVPLDEVVQGPVRLIKIDVEGAEVGVIRGAGRIIREHRPHLIIENNPDTLKHFGHSFDDVLEAVRAHNGDYEVVSIDGWRETTWSLSTKAAELPDKNLWLRPKGSGR